MQVLSSHPWSQPAWARTSWADDVSLQQATTFTLKAEGRYTPIDGGTMYGVTQAVYDDYRDSVGLPEQSVALITMDEVLNIMRGLYWTPAACDKLPTKIGIAHFDFAYNHGAHGANVVLQGVLGVVQDGIIGPESIHAVVAAEQINLLEKYLNARRDWYRADTAQTEYLKGWLNRVDALQAYLAGVP